MCNFKLFARALLIFTAAIFSYGFSFALTPDKIIEESKLLFTCKSLFDEFDVKDSKHNGIGIVVYKSDKDRIDTMFKGLLDRATRKFGKSDASKMIMEGAVESSFRFSDAKWTQKGVVEIATACRNYLHSD